MANMETQQIIDWLRDKAVRADNHSWQRMMSMAADRLAELDRPKVEVSFYDKEETYPNCTVQVLTNTVTGDVSVGWWKNGGAEDGKC